MTVANFDVDTELKEKNSLDCKVSYAKLQGQYVDDEAVWYLSVLRHLRPNAKAQIKRAHCRAPLHTRTGMRCISTPAPRQSLTR